MGAIGKFGLILAGVALLSTLPVAAGKTMSDYDPGADFAAYKTFAWKNGTPAKSHLMDKRIVGAIERQLESVGMTKTDGEPDVYVLYHAALDSERRVAVDDFGYWGRWRFPTTTSVDVYDVQIGTLIVDLLDGESNEGVWRGYAERELSGKPSPEKMDKRLRKVLAKMFRNYPPE